MSSCSELGDSAALDSRKGAWTAREDAALSARVAKYGTKSWTTIASGVEGRSAKSCRLRWYNQLCPGVKRTPFSEWEQAVIIKAQKIHTNKWAALAKLLKGRTDNAIKNHWNATLSRKLNNPAENFRNQFVERGVSLEWLLAHPELDTSNDIEEALAARNYNNTKVGLAALKGIKKKKRRSTPSSPSYSDGMLTPTAASSRPSKFQAIAKKQDPSSELSGLTGSSRQISSSAAAVAAAALPRQLSSMQQQQQPLYCDSYGYSYAMPVGSSGGGLTSSSYSAAASAAAMGHAPTCLTLAGGICSCWQGAAAGVQGYSSSLAGAGAGSSYVNYPDGSLQPSWQGGLGDMTGYAPVGDFGASPFGVFGAGDAGCVTGELAGSSTRLHSAGGATAADPAAAGGAGAMTQGDQLQGGTTAGTAGTAKQQQQHHDQPSSSSMSSGSPVRPGLVGSSGNVTPVPAGSHCTSADAPAASSRTTVTPVDSHKLTSAHLGPNPTGAWATQGLVMGPPSDALGPLGLRPVGQGKLLSPAAYDLLMSGVVPSSRSSMQDVQYKNGGNAAAAGALAAAAGGSSGGMASPRCQQQQSSQLQLQHSLPAPATAFNSSGGAPPNNSGALEPSPRPMGRSFSYDVSFNPMLAGSCVPPPAGSNSAGGAYRPGSGLPSGLLPPSGPTSSAAYMAGGSSGGAAAAAYDPSLPPNMQQRPMARSYSTPPQSYGPPLMGGLPYSISAGGRPSAGGGCGVPGCTDPACWGYVGAEGPSMQQPGMLPPPGLPYGPLAGGLGASSGQQSYGNYPGAAAGQQPAGGILSSFGSAPAPGFLPQGRRSGSASGLPDSTFMMMAAAATAGGGYGASRSAGGGLQQQHDHADMLLGIPSGLLSDGPVGAAGMLSKQQAGGGSSMQRQQQQHKQQQQQQQQPLPGTPGFSWDSVGEALQGFGEGAGADSLAWDDLADFDLPDLKQHDVDELLNF